MFWTAFEHSLGAPTTQKDGKPVLTANGGLLNISLIQSVFTMI